MADDDANLVSEIQIKGADQSAEQLKRYGDEGAAAFDKIADAAKGADDAVSKATGGMAKGMEDVAKAAAVAPSKVQALATAASGLGTAVRAGAGQIAAFGSAMAGLTIAGATAIAGIAKFASSVTATVREVNRANVATNELLQQQKKGTAQWAQSVASAASYQSQLRQLNESVANGKMGFEDYNQAILDLNNTYQEQLRVQAEVQSAQDEVLRKNQELTRAAEQRKAYDDLANAYGNTLAGALIKLGAAYDNVRNQVRDAFGPVAASLVDRITALIEKNSTAITKFIDDAATAMGKFFDENGPAIEKLVAQVAEIGAAFMKVVVTIIIPAATNLMTVLNNIAMVINKVFGTDINGAFLAVVVTIGTMTGAFSTLVTVIGGVVTAVAALVAAFNPLTVIIGALIIAFTALALSIDWTAFAQRAIAAGQAIVNFFTAIPQRLGEIFTAFFQSIVDGFTGAVQYIMTAWQAVVDYFTGLVQTVRDIFAQIGQAISDAFKGALDYVVQLFTEWTDKVLEFIKPVLDALKRVRDMMSQTSATGGRGAAVTAATGGHVRGPGTSTSDSIPAWLSNNEFVIRAKSVAKYGVGFLKALNAGKINVGNIAGYALGGLVSLPRNSTHHYAAGGLVQGGPRNVLNLTLDGQAFNGLLATEDTFDKLRKHAVQRSLSPRKPNWYK